MLRYATLPAIAIAILLCLSVVLIPEQHAASQPTLIRTPQFAFPASRDGTRSASEAIRVLEAPTCTAPPPGMVAWWPGEGNGNDIRGENDGTPQGGVTFPAGEVEHAFSFDGTNDQGVLIGNPASLQLQDFTIDAWTKRSSPDFTTVTGPLGAGAIVAYGHDGYGLGMFSDGRLELSKVDGVFVDSGSSPRVTDTNFHHVAVTKSGNSVVFYVDGVAGAPIAFNETFAFTKNLSIGARLDLSAPTTSPTDTSTFAGLIDEVEIFSRALSQSEIQAIVDVGSAGKCRPRCVAPPSGMISWYTGDDNPFDIFGTNHGTLQNGATFGNGKVGRAFSFDGIDDFVEAPHTANLDFGPTTPLSVDLWAFPTSTAGTQHLIGERIQCGLDSFTWQVSEDSASGLGFGSAAGFVTTGASLPLNTWTHITGTFDGSTLRIYVNGVLAGTKVGTLGPDIDAPLRIGTSGSCHTTGQAFGGRIDEVEIFNRALDITEIQAINNGASAGKCKPCLTAPGNMVGWWNGDANSNDTSGLTNHGTLLGAAGYGFGEVSQAFRFNSAGAGVSIPDPSFLLRNKFTLDAWVKPTDLSSHDQMILSKWDALNNINNSYELLLQADGSVRANISGDGTTLDSLVSGPGLVSAGVWSHVATTKIDFDWSIYVNGIQVASKTSSVFSAFSPSTADLLIGRDAGTTHDLNGLIDEVEIFDRDLSEPEIQSMVAAGPSGKCKSINHNFDKADESRARTATKSPVHPDDTSTDQVGDATVTMVDAMVFGETDYQTLPTYQQGPMPFGYGDPLEIADISTTTTFDGGATICFTLLSISDSEEDFFNHLRILHLEGNVLVDRTSSHYFPLRYLCATIPAGLGFSPFVISQNQNLTPSAANGNIGGTITDASGAPVSGVTINLSGTMGAEAITDSSGKYNFFDVETNGFYTVTPSHPNYTFSPANRSFSLLGVHTEASFTATANNSHLNPLDTTEFFVRQHYLDFLGREPDPPGLIGWVNTINNCAAGDPSCDRVHVSEAFFRSQEFQERGYFVYRFYSSAFGRKPDFAEFTPDLRRVSGFLTNDQLEAAKTSFANDFVNRPAFAQYATMNNTQYVDALAATAGVTLSNRQALVDSLNAGTLTKAQALRQIAESGEVYQKYYNQAFVVMEYFGYLRRDPDILYLNWIAVLDANPADSRRMVEGFVNATEYRNRFRQ